MKMKKLFALTASILMIGTAFIPSKSQFSTLNIVAEATQYTEQQITAKANSLLKEWNITPNYNMTEVEKYQMISKLADKFKSYYTYDLSIDYEIGSSADSLIIGKGSCRGISLSFWILLKQAGFDEDDLRGCGNYCHAWNVIRINKIWYYLDMTTYITENSNNYKNRYLINADTFLKLDSVATKGFNACKATSIEGTDYDNSFEFNDCDGTGIKGDATGDGIINVRDQSIMQRYLTYGTIASNLDVVNADINCDNTVNVRDMAALSNMLS